MPLPTSSDVHVNRPLTNMSVAIIQDEANFVADTVFPNIPVQKQSDAYYSYDNAYWNNDEMAIRAPATETVGNGYKVDPNNTYYAPIYGFHKDIPDPVRANADVPLNPDMEATRYVTLKALIKKEKIFASTFLKTGIWGTDITGVDTAPSANQVLKWSDVGSHPIENVWDGKQAVLEKTGFEPNVLAITYPVLKTLINHPEFIDRVKYGQAGVGQPAMIDVSEIAALFKVEKVVVMRSIEVTSKEGAVSKVSSFIGGRSALLAYAPPAAGIMTPSAGYTFSWVGYLGAGPAGNRIKRFRMENIASDRIEIEMAFAMKLISGDLGYFFNTITV